MLDKNYQYPWGQGQSSGAATLSRWSEASATLVGPAIKFCPGMGKLGHPATFGAWKPLVRIQLPGPFIQYGISPT